MAGLLDRWRRGREASRRLRQIERWIDSAEAGAPGDAAAAIEALAGLRREGATDEADLDLLEARALFAAGHPREALAPAHRAADRRPYDVDSRVTHGLICLALDRLTEAEHEFESVLEEFGGDPDAENGRRAVSLAKGKRPLDEHALPEDVDDAAALLRRCWSRAGAVETRLAALREAGADTAVLAALSAQAPDANAGD